jgi:hypothetical protein
MGDLTPQTHIIIIVKIGEQVRSEKIDTVATNQSSIKN